MDDDYTGTNFNRPGVQEGFDPVKQGLVGCWLVKDLSRFGRDYLTVGQYTDIIFPSIDVRVMPANDGGTSEGVDVKVVPPNGNRLQTYACREREFA